MDVNSIMNTYDMISFWNSENSAETSNFAGLPLVDNLDSSIQENYVQSNYFGQTTNSELQDIYQQVEPSYGMPVSYDSSGNFFINNNTTPPVNGFSSEYSNILPLLQSGESSSDLNSMNILNEYYSIEDGTYQPNNPSIFSSNPYDMYNNVDSLLNSQSQNSGGYLDSMI